MTQRPGLRASDPAGASSADVVDDRLRSLRRRNLGVGTLLMVQALAVSLLARGPHVAIDAAGHGLGRVSVAVGAVLGLVVAGAYHLAVATVVRERYEAALEVGTCALRWIAYAGSASAMVLAVCGLVGVTSLETLIGVAGCTLAMVGFCWVQEATTAGRRTATTLAPLRCGALVGLVPWVVVGLGVVRAPLSGPLVVNIVVSTMLFVLIVGLNQWLYYRLPRRPTFLAFEQRHAVLSLVALTALAWQVVALGRLGG